MLEGTVFSFVFLGDPAREGFVYCKTAFTAGDDIGNC